MISRPLFLIFFLSIVSSTPSSADNSTAGILFSGGHHTTAEGTSVEVYVPSTGLSCSIPSLPDDRWGHSMDMVSLSSLPDDRWGHSMDMDSLASSPLICGGYDSASTAASCLSFSSGQWVYSHSLVEGRADHTTWQTDQGLLLMGGYVPYDSEMVHMDQQQGEPFYMMKDDVKEACSITDKSGDSVILTGGFYTKDKVSRYGIGGFVEDLPSLVEGRFGHGCGSYIRPDGIQVFLVAGGWDGNINLSSTEIMSSDSLTWTMTWRLPRPLYALRGVTVSNTLYMTGGEDGHFRNEIIAWKDEEQTWEEIGYMKTARYYHAVTAIKLDNPLMEYCV